MNQGFSSSPHDKTPRSTWSTWSQMLELNVYQHETNHGTINIEIFLHGTKVYSLYSIGGQHIRLNYLLRIEEH